MGKTPRCIVPAWMGTGLAQDDAAAAHAEWRSVADQHRPAVPKLAALTDAAEAELPAPMYYPAARQAKLQ